MTLETIASKFELPTESGIFVILGPPKSGKSSIIVPDLLLTSEFSLGEIEQYITKFNETSTKRPGKIVMDEVNVRFYKSPFFKTLMTNVKFSNLQLFIISQSVRDLPPLLRSNVNYWFLFLLDNNYISFPPLNELASWTEPPRKSPFTAIVAQLTREGEKPNIWWYNSHDVKPPEVPERRRSRRGADSATTAIDTLVIPAVPVAAETVATATAAVAAAVASNNEQVLAALAQMQQKFDQLLVEHSQLRGQYTELIRRLTDLDKKIEEVLYE